MTDDGNEDGDICLLVAVVSEERMKRRNWYTDREFNCIAIIMKCILYIGELISSVWIEYLSFIFATNIRKKISITNFI